MLSNVADAAWLVGMLEGEGSFSVCLPAGQKNKTIQIQIKSTDEDVIRRVRAVTGKYREEMRDFLFAILPFMGERRTGQILKALREVV